MPKEIQLAQVEPNVVVMVNGKMGYNHLPFYEGAELQKKVQQDIERGSKYPTTWPHDEVTIYDASIKCAVPGQPNLAEQYVAQSFYTSKAQGYTGKAMTWRQRKYNENTSVPWVGEARDGKVVQIDTKGQTLATGLDVTLVLTTFKAKMGNGMRLVGVICNEPVKYFGSNVDSLLASRGINFVACETTDETVATEEEEVPFSDAPADNPFSFDASEEEAPEDVGMDNDVAPGVNYDTSIFS